MQSATTADVASAINRRLAIVSCWSRSMASTPCTARWSIGREAARHRWAGP